MNTTHIPPMALSGETPLITAASPDITQQVNSILDQCLGACTSLRTRNYYSDSQWSEVSNDRFLKLHQPELDDVPLVYVRPCYLDIYHSLSNMWQGSKSTTPTHRCAAIITGTPGIGKSIGGRVICQMALNRQKPVLLLYSSSFRPGNVEIIWQSDRQVVRNDWLHFENLIIELQSQGLLSRKSHDKDNIEVWSIGDTCVPACYSLACNLICITSPGQTLSTDFGSSLKEWKKTYGPFNFTIPTCSWEELLCIRKCQFDFDEAAAHRLCPLSDLKEKFNHWGGVPRTLIKYPESLKDYVENFEKLRIKHVLK